MGNFLEQALFSRLEACGCLIKAPGPAVCAEPLHLALASGVHRQADAVRFVDR